MRCFTSILSSLVFTSTVLFLQGCNDSSHSLTASVTGGEIQGEQHGRTISFKGIPYAAAPIGELRWRSPQPVKKWQGTKLVSNYGADCMQKPFASDAAPLGTEPAEDCLFINVTRPSKTAENNYPVVVWFHGGGFVNGGASPEVYSGESFAKQGIVFVSFNYRLGRFGFFAHPALSKLENDALGNYAFMDQIAALEWVKKNISQFAGDPNNVTIMGESAGGASVHAMMQTPAAQGLFQRAIIMSAGGRELFKQLPLHSNDKNQLSAEKIGENFANKYQLTGTDEELLTQLRALRAEDIVDGLNLSTLHSQNNTSPTYSGGPIMDGTIIKAPPGQRLQQGKFSQVPVLVGTTDMDIGFANYPSKQALFDSFTTRSQQAQLSYDAQHKVPLQQLNYQVGQDELMQEPARYVAAQVTKLSQPAYLYRFGYVAQTEKAPGATHASEIPYFFNTVADKYGHLATEQDKQAAKVIHRYVGNFIKSGNPNGPGLANWLPYQINEHKLLLITKYGTAEYLADPLASRLNLIKFKSEQKQ